MGHNLVTHDLPILQQAAPWLNLHHLPVIDTLRLSPIAFPQNPYHRLIKNHKLISSAQNSPLADCLACWTLFQDQCVALQTLKDQAPQEAAVCEHLFGPLPGLIQPVTPQGTDGGRKLAPAVLHQAIRQMLHEDAGDTALKVCRTRLQQLLDHDLADPALQLPIVYVLSWLRVAGGNSVLAPWVRQQFPDTARLIRELRDVPAPILSAPIAATRWTPPCSCSGTFTPSHPFALSRVCPAVSRPSSRPACVARACWPCCPPGVANRCAFSFRRSTGITAMAG